MPIQRIYHQYYKFIIFCFVGGSAALVHLGGVFLLVEVCGLRPAVANVFGVLSAFFVSFLGHYKFTFHTAKMERKGTSIYSALVKWMVVSLFGFSLNQLLYVYLLYELSSVNYFVLLFFVCAVIALITYLLGNFWAFKRSDS